MLKHVGKRLDVTGEVQELEGRKVLTPWLIVPSGAKVRRPGPTDATARRHPATVGG